MSLKRFSVLISGTICLLIAFTLFGCSGGESADSGASSNATTENAKEANNVFNIGDYTAEFTKAEIGEDAGGEPALLVHYKFTNNSKDSQSFIWAFTNKAFQNGVQLDTATVWKSEGSFDTVSDSTFSDIQPGISLDVCETYVLQDTTTPVTVEVTGLLSDKKKSFEINPAELDEFTPGA